ncbi:MAG: DUF883 domain-containing protein [Phycisphaeraceae bacterium]|nr:DUF883 domain-containing protein [Phycisphaeraceae bacterium]
MTTHTDFPQTDGIHQDLDAIKQDLMSLRSNLSDILSDFMNYGKNQAGEARDKLESTLQERLTQFKEKAGEFRRQGSDTVERVGKQIEHRPWTAVGVAAGFGLLLGALMARR